MKFFKQIDIYYIITLLFLLLSANASFLSASDVIWFAVLLFITVVGLSKKLLAPADLKVIAIFSLIYIAFVSIRDIGFNGLDPEYLISDILFLFKFIFLAFIYCTVLKEKVSYYIVKVMAHLTIVSFVFFFLQIVGFRDYIYNYSQALNLKSAYSIDGYTNFVIFTLVRGIHDYRNSGFVWEPGAFGCFLIIALMLNFFLNKFKYDRKSYIFIIAIITTISTTDYLALIIVLFLVYRYKVPKVNWGAVALMLVAAVVFTYIPILGDKILGTYYEDMDDLKRLKYLEIFYRRNHSQIPLNRFASMVYIYKQFGYQLILGVSNKYDVIVNSKFNINISNGLFDFMAKFGLVGLVFLVYKYARFCIATVLKAEYIVYCIFILLIVGFGEPIMILPFILIFIFIQKKQLKPLKQYPDEKEAL